ALQDSPFAPSVSAVAPELSTSAQLVAGRKNTSPTVIGVTPEYQFVRNFPVESGRFIGPGHVESSAMVAVLGSSVARDLYGFRSPIGQTLRINGRQFDVVGVLKEKGGSSFFSFDDRVMIPITTAYYRLSSQRTTQGSISVQTINVQIEDVSQIDAALAEVAAAMTEVLTVTARSGSTQRRLELTRDNLQVAKINLESYISQAEDVDLAEAILRFNSQELGFRAALESSTRIQRITILDYLR
ncbi:MAG: ABC transporter permease, partial [Candidatus Marinimicrobia bacterium]|nr:ABC transporter permease [Candidatus Neomarinimicrobiota bacterium]